MHADLPIESLRDYRSSHSEPADFDAFWAETLATSRALADKTEMVAVASPLQLIDVFDVTFSGYRGQRVRAWLRVPRQRRTPLPVVVEFVGYGGGRGEATDGLLMAASGFAHVTMDTRGQGSVWSRGETADEGASGPQFPGFATRGVLRPETYYYRRVFADAVMLLEALTQLPMVDASRIALMGASQGAGIALAAAGLASQKICALVARMPFLADFPRAIRITDALPYGEIAGYLAVHADRVDEVLATLAYFDAVNFAPRGRAPAQFTVALMDVVTPPSTVFGVFNAYAGPKSILELPFAGHEAAGRTDVRDIEFLRSALAATTSG